MSVRPSADPQPPPSAPASASDPPSASDPSGDPAPLVIREFIPLPEE